MKTTILLLLLAFNTTAQEVKQVNKEVLYNNINSTRLVAYYGTDTNYVLYFRNLEYQYATDIKHLTFDKDELTTFLDTAEKANETKQEYYTDKWLIKKTYMGIYVGTKGGYFFLKPAQVKKIKSRL